VTARRRGSSRGPAEEESERESFASLVEGSDPDLRLDDVERVRDRDKRVGPTRRTGPGRAPAEPTRFHHPQPDEPLLGQADGIQSSQLRKLRAGRIRPDARIDLHGLRADAARRHVLAELSSAAAAGIRCAIVIHGRGLRSPAEPVLRKSLPEWLASPELEGRVLAFAPAAPADGGTGATYVLLRRKRG